MYRSHKRKALMKGSKKIEESLDVIKLIRNGRTLKTLLRLLLNKQARSFMPLKQRYTVLEHLEDSSGDEKPDHSMIG